MIDEYSLADVFYPYILKKHVFLRENGVVSTRATTASDSVSLPCHMPLTQCGCDFYSVSPANNHGRCVQAFELTIDVQEPSDVYFMSAGWISELTKTQFFWELAEFETDFEDHGCFSALYNFKMTDLNFRKHHESNPTSNWPRSGSARIQAPMVIRLARQLFQVSFNGCAVCSKNVETLPLDLEPCIGVIARWAGSWPTLSITKIELEL
jgi:hypothetical protein